MNKKLSLFAIAFCLAVTVIMPVYAEEGGNLFADPDRGWFYLTNVSNTTIFKGNVAYYATASTVVYGEDAKIGSQPTTLVAGIAMDDILPNRIGRIQVRGYHPAALLSYTNGVSIGQELIPSGYGLISNDNNTSISPRFVALETVASCGGDRMANDGNDGASNPTVKVLINLR